MTISKESVTNGDGTERSSQEEECLTDFLNHSVSPKDLKVKERIKPSKLVQRSLVTISESSEILYPLSFKNISLMDKQLIVPPLSPAVEGGERLSVYVSYDPSSDVDDLEEDMDDEVFTSATTPGANVSSIGTPTSSSSSSGMNDVSEELSALKDRAKKLSEELRRLTKSAFSPEEHQEHISQEKIRSILNEPLPQSSMDDNRSNLFEEMKKRLHPVTVVEVPSAPMRIEPVETPAFIRINADCYVMESDDEDEEEEEEEEFEEEEEPPKIIEEKKTMVSPSPSISFDYRGPKPKEEKPTFLDLSLEGEKRLVGCKGGPRDWQMPFREKLYFESKYQGQEKEIDFTNPIFYAPTGDIYSYFKRRQLYPHPFKMPTQYQIKKVLSNQKKQSQQGTLNMPQ